MTLGEKILFFTQFSLMVKYFFNSDEAPNKCKCLETSEEFG